MMDQHAKQKNRLRVHRILTVYAHPDPGSFCHAVLQQFTSIPPPEPRSSTVSPGFNSAKVVGLLIRPLYVAISLASWQPRKHSAPPRAVPPEKLRQEKTECRLGIFRTSLGGRPSILSELPPRKVCGLFHLRSTCTSESLL